MFNHKEPSLLGQHLIPHPDKTLFWREEQLLIVADPHFGKTQIFRENGISIPGGTTAIDLERLSCRNESSFAICQPIHKLGLLILIWLVQLIIYPGFS